MNPVVSIVIPAYNAARFIEAALASAAAQTERRVEILVVDDCSTDDTAAVAERFVRGEPRARLLRTPRNGGPAAARNVGFAAARGEWIAILDADDLFELERIEVLLALAHARGADMCADNLLQVFEDGGTPERMLPPNVLGEETRLSLAAFIEGDARRSARRLSFGFLQPMFRRGFLEEHGLRYDESVRFAEDFGLAVDCLRAGAVWWVTPRPMYRYLIRKGTLTEVQTSQDLDRLRRRDRALLADPRVRQDRRAASAVRRHLRNVEQRYYYRAFTDAVKARAWPRAAGLLFEDLSAFPLITLEGLRQAPVILRKALRGGYRTSASQATSAAGV